MTRNDVAEWDAPAAVKAAYVAARTDHAKVRTDILPLVDGGRHWIILSTHAEWAVETMGGVLEDCFNDCEPSPDDLFTAVLNSPLGPLLVTVLPKSKVSTPYLAGILGSDEVMRAEENLAASDFSVVEETKDRFEAVRDWFEEFINAG